MVLPNMIPTAFNAVIHDASSIVIVPVDSGDASEVSRRMLGLDHPVIMPYTIPSNDTFHTKKNESTLTPRE